MRTLASALLLFFFVPGARIIDMTPALATGKVAGDPDDPAIWRHPTDPAQTLILGTDKASPNGALHVFGLDGKERQVITGLDRPNNVDVRDNLAVLTERNKQQLRVFRIDPASGKLSEAGAIPVFTGQSGDRALAMGIALYRRKGDGALFAIVSRKSGPSGAYLWQYRLTDDGTRVTGEKVREFGQYSGGAKNEIEAVAVDDAEGYVYYSDETCCVRKYYADPQAPGARNEVARHATDKFEGQREGIAITQFWLIVTDQIAGKSQYHVYAKRGQALRPIFILRGNADSTDGIEAIDTPLPGFPNGLLVAMNSSAKNFLLFALKQRY